MYTYPKSVSEAAKLLDTIDKLWYTKINIDTLAMNSCYACVLGQVFKYYRTAMRELFDITNNPETFCMEEEIDDVFGTNTDVSKWIKEIQARRL